MISLKGLSLMGVGRGPLGRQGTLATRRALSLPPPRFQTCPGVRCFAAGSPTEVTVVEGEEGVRYHNVAESGRHTLPSDLMPEAGGRDLGPSPKELVMAGLGSCTCMTVRIFADNMGYPLEKVQVKVKDNTLPGEHLPQGLEVELSLEGNLTSDQRERLLRASGRCPVKRMLHGDMTSGISSILV